MANDTMSKMVVLVVEDESIIRTVLAYSLEDAGFFVKEAARADIAIAILTSDEAIDAVITDIRMPGHMGGLGLARWIRDNRENLPVIVTSGYVNEEELHEANPNALIVSKPYAAKDVLSVLATLVGPSVYRQA